MEEKKTATVTTEDLVAEAAIEITASEVQDGDFPGIRLSLGGVAVAVLEKSAESGQYNLRVFRNQVDDYALTVYDDTGEELYRMEELSK